ncbi:hypothetical protein D3C81_1888470 [compost metagenome]
MLDIALEIPLALFLLGRLLQRDDARTPRVQVLHEALDGATLACRIPPFEQHYHALAGVLDPALYLQQLDLQRVLGLLVFLAAHAGRVGVARR